jgi:hypothetical protein
MLDRLRRSWELAMQCLAALREDEAQLVLPLFSPVAILLITASCAAAWRPAGWKPGELKA